MRAQRERSFADRFSRRIDQLQEAQARLQRLRARAGEPGNAVETEERREALLFGLERAAWAAIQVAAEWVFEARLGVARKETENFDLLARADLIGLELGRKLRQASEWRKIASQDPAAIESMLRDLRAADEDLDALASTLVEWEGVARRRLSLEKPEKQSEE